MSLKESIKAHAIFMCLLMGLSLAGFSASAVAQDGPPPPPPGAGMMTGQTGPGVEKVFFHAEFGEGHEEPGEGKVVKGAPMTATMTMTHDTTLADGNTIHTENQTTVYRDSQGRVRREIGFELNTPTTGARKGNMIMIMDPVSGNRYMLNPQNKTAHQMPLRPPRPGDPGAANGEPRVRPDQQNVATEQLGPKTILGLAAQGTRVTRTIPAGQIGNTNPIEVVSERWFSSDLQIPLLTIHTDPMMGTMTNKVTSISRGEPDASLFQVPSDYKMETGKPGDMFYMRTKP